MQEVTSTDFQRNVADSLAAAHDEPILITQRGKGRFVVCSHARYSELWNAWKRERGELVEADEEVLHEVRG